MICPNCGAENAQGAPYCYNCANPLPQAGAVPPGSVPPGSVPPGSVPPGAMPPGAVPPGPAVPPGAVPPGSAPPPGMPPGGGYVPPGGGYTPGPPVKPPRNTFSAGLGALIAFLVVTGIGVVLFLTVFHKSNDHVVGPTASPVATTGTTGPTGTTATTGTTGPTGTTATTGTTGPTGTTATTGTTGPTGTTATTGTTTPPSPTKPKPPPTKKASFHPFFCRTAPSAAAVGGGCQEHLVLPTGRPFFFVIRTLNVPAGVKFSVSLVLKGTNRSVLDFDLKPTTGQQINRLIQGINPVSSVFTGVTVVAVIQANGQATTCNGQPCTQNDEASVTFT